MTDSSHAPWQDAVASSGTAMIMHASPELPPEVATCLKNARFLHLATCHNEVPHVSLMNYTYLPSTPFSLAPIIIMTTHASSRKTLNLRRNRRVSMLVHDWVQHRQTTAQIPEEPPLAPSAAGENTLTRLPSQPRSSLSNLLLQLNSSSLSSISTTINGIARIVPPGSEEEAWCKASHVQNHAGPSNEEGDGGRECYIESREVEVVVVQILNGRISDWKGGIRDFVIEDPSASSPVDEGHVKPLDGPNGVNVETPI